MFNSLSLHVPSLYDLVSLQLHYRVIQTIDYYTYQSSSDLPLLVTVRDLGRRLLDSLLNPSDSAPNTPVTANPTRPLTVDTHLHATLDDKLFRIGFITSPFRDNKIPVTDHLHAHAYILPADLMGWWRSVGYSGLAWYAVDDLIAEIRYAFYPHPPVLPSRFRYHMHDPSVHSTAVLCESSSYRSLSSSTDTLLRVWLLYM